jgi:hypothetical protein
MRTLTELATQTHISKPKRPRRRWAGQLTVRDAVYAHRERSARAKGNALLLRPNSAHCLESGAMIGVHLRGHATIAKRCLLHVAASSLGLLMHRVLGVGTPRRLKDRIAKALAGLLDDRSALVARLVIHLAGLDRRRTVLDHSQTSHPLQLVAA